MSAPALAATITVGPTCALADAIESANTNADAGGCTHEGVYGDDIVVLPAATYDFTAPSSGANALPAVTSNIAIVGAGSTLRRPLGNSAPFFRFFQVSSGHLKLLDLTITGGLIKSASSANGGAIRVTGSASLTLARVTLTGNTADGSDDAADGDQANGGAIFFDSSGVLTLDLVTLTNNAAVATGATDGGTARGGAILVGDEDDQGTLSMTDVTATGNSVLASGLGGAGGTAEGAVVRYRGRSAMTVTRGTFTGNSAIANGGANHGGSAEGGAIHFRATEEAGTLALASVIASGNTLSAVGAAPGNGGSAEGGGLYFRSNGTGLAVRDSTFSNNTLNANAGTGKFGGGAEGGGAKIQAGGTGTITIVRSAFTGNTQSADGGTLPGGNGGSADGGGISFPSSGNLVLISVTVANNTSSADGGTGFGGSSDGGGIYFNSSGTLTLVNGTIAGNTGSAAGGGTSEGGGVYLDFGSATLQNSLFAANLAAGVVSNCARDDNEVLTSLGNNFFDNGAGCNAVGPGDTVGGSPGLGSLTDTGQPGGIHLPLLPGSAALDSANAAACPTIDQLAHPRDGTCDIGAVERIAAIPQTTLVAAVLPSGRAGLVGNLLTAFVTVINTGATTAFQVGIGLGTTAPVLVSFQTTDPSTNALTGTVNTPADIAPGGLQTFVVALLATGPFDPTQLALTYAGVNTAPVAPILGLNTLLVSASLTAIADVIALNATAGGNGIVDIPGDTGNGSFAVATINLGATDSITVEANTGAASLGVLIFICQTDPATAACLEPPESSVTTVIATNATPTYGVFVAGGDPIPFDPGTNRIFVLLIDSSGKIRGGTSVAVRTVAP